MHFGGNASSSLGCSQLLFILSSLFYRPPPPLCSLANIICNEIDSVQKAALLILILLFMHQYVVAAKRHMLPTTSLPTNYENLFGAR